MYNNRDLFGCMITQKDYRKLYDALPYKRKQQALALFKEWGHWSKATVYNKLAGDAVTPIEKVMLEGVFAAISSPKQLEFDFFWDIEDNRPNYSLR